MMFLIEKFCFIFSIETGGRITSWYCSFVNCAYITVLMMLLNSFDVLNEKMTGFEKFQILMVATCVNFFIYYIFGSMVLTVGVLEVSEAWMWVAWMWHAKALSATVFLLCVFYFMDYFSLNVIFFIFMCWRSFVVQEKFRQKFSSSTQLK